MLEESPKADRTNETSLRSVVNMKDAGVIIGRGGKNVNEIREFSGARVTISDIVPGAYDRILTVSGRVDAVAKVKGTCPLSPPSENKDAHLVI